MSHEETSHEHAGHDGGGAAVAHFSNAELATMHDEDRKAAANIVLLMGLVFLAGVIGYIIVAYICSQGH
jgi:hypothetical protein